MNEMFAVALMGLVVGLPRKKKSTKMLSTMEKICHECLNKYELSFENCPKDGSKLVGFDPGPRIIAKPADIKKIGWSCKDTGRIDGKRSFTAIHKHTKSTLEVIQEPWPKGISLEKSMKNLSLSVKSTNIIKGTTSGITANGVKCMIVFSEYEDLKMLLSVARYKDDKDGVIRIEIIKFDAPSIVFRDQLMSLMRCNVFQCYDLKGNDMILKIVK